MRLLAFVLLNEIVVSLPRACRVPLPLSAAGAGAREPDWAWTGAEQQGRPSPGCYARLVDVVSVLSEYHGVPLLPKEVTQIGRRSWRRCRAT